MPQAKKKEKIKLSRSMQCDSHGHCAVPTNLSIGLNVVEVKNERCDVALARRQRVNTQVSYIVKRTHRMQNSFNRKRVHRKLRKHNETVKTENLQIILSTEN